MDTLGILQIVVYSYLWVHKEGKPISWIYIYFVKENYYTHQDERNLV